MIMANEAQIRRGGLEEEMVDEEEMEFGDDNEFDDDTVPDSDDNGHTATRHIPDAAEWVSLTNHPTPTVTKVQQTLASMDARGKKSLTVLVLGRAGSGKSTTINSIFGSNVAQVVAFHMITFQNVQPLIIRKKSAGVEITVIDTPGIVESDTVSETGLKRIAFQTRNHPVDVVLYIDRLDMPKPEELDKQICSGITRMLGKDIWSRVVIGLTRAEIRNPPPGQSYESIVRKRVEDIRNMIQKAGAKQIQLPYALIENSRRCQQNAYHEKVLPNGTVWLPALFEKLVEVSLTNTTGFKYDPKTINKSANLITKFCIIPLVFVAQILFKVFILDRLIEEDGIRGDQYGPFDRQVTEYARKRVEERKCTLEEKRPKNTELEALNEANSSIKSPTSLDSGPSTRRGKPSFLEAELNSDEEDFDDEY